MCWDRVSSPITVFAPLPQRQEKSNKYFDFSILPANPQDPQFRPDSLRASFARQSGPQVRQRFAAFRAGHVEPVTEISEPQLQHLLQAPVGKLPIDQIGVVQRLE